MLLDVIFKDPGQDIADLGLNDSFSQTKNQWKRWGAMLLDLIVKDPGKDIPLPSRLPPSELPQSRPSLDEFSTSLTRARCYFICL